MHVLYSLYIPLPMWCLAADLQPWTLIPVRPRRWQNLLGTELPAAPGSWLPPHAEPPPPRQSGKDSWLARVKIENQTSVGISHLFTGQVSKKMLFGPKSSEVAFNVVFPFAFGMRGCVGQHWLGNILTLWQPLTETSDCNSWLNWNHQSDISTKLALQKK